MNKFLVNNGVVVQVWKNNTFTDGEYAGEVFETTENVVAGMTYKKGKLSTPEIIKSEDDIQAEFEQKIEDFIYSKYPQKEQSQDTVWLISGLADAEKKGKILQKMKWAKDVITAFKEGQTPPEFTL